MLTKDDLYNIAYYCNNETSDNELFVPRPRIPEELSEATIEAIRQTYADKAQKELENYNVQICQYYGTYNDCIVIRRNGWFEGPNATEIDGILFKNFTYAGIDVWVPNE